MCNINPLDLFKPYSPEVRGDLLEYLRTHDGLEADNLFFGPEYFFIIQARGFMRPQFTHIRVNRSPIPDVSYYVNSDFLLESEGEGHINMSCIGAARGIYNPLEALREQLWTIYGLNLSD